VQHRSDADACAQMLLVRRDGRHRLRRRLDLERDVGDLSRQRKYDVEVADRQQVGSRSASQVRAGVTG